MIYELKMPDLTTNDSPIRIVRWIARPGDTVERGQPLLEAETDKATMEIESAVSGRLDRVLCEVDEEVSVGHVIASHGDCGHDAERVHRDRRCHGVRCTVTQPPLAPAVAASPADGPSRLQLPASRLACLHAIAPQRPRQKVPTTSLPLSVAQRTAAKRLQSSKQTIPHFYLQTSFDASTIVARRQAAEPLKLAWDAFFVRAVARAIRRFDRFRCRFDGEQLVVGRLRCDWRGHRCGQ